jgi:hypothetical protein
VAFRRQVHVCSASSVVELFLPWKVARPIHDRGDVVARME